MKLSTAIREGAKTGVQGLGDLSSNVVRRRTFWEWLRGEPKIQTQHVTCALGGAFEAEGCAEYTRPYSEGDARPFRGTQSPLLGQTITVIQHPWNDTLALIRDCPQCEFSDALFRLIPHLNDHHRWSRNEIALFIERIEQGIENKGVISPVRCHDGDGTRESPFRERYAHGELDDVLSGLCYIRLQSEMFLQKMFPHVGTCGRCRWPWTVVRSHATYYGNGGGCFPLCEDCWTELRTPEKRMPYYMALVDYWVADHKRYAELRPDVTLEDPENKRWSISQAVLAEGLETRNDDVLTAKFLEV